MATQYLNVLAPEEIDLLLNIPEVLEAKASIDAKASGSVTLSVTLPASIKDAIHKSLGLDFDTVPMRWIKGDTPAHKDSGAGAFQNTYLVYLTDSQGDLVVDGTPYPITQGTGYVFSEGLRHETLNTGSEPRLLLGPMSETGFAVGVGAVTLSADGTTDTIYIKYESNNLYYQINTNGWNEIIGVPIIIINTAVLPQNNILKIIFTTNITISNNQSFICGSNGIQFGSKTLNNDGGRPIINMDGIQDYQGFNGFIGNGFGYNSYNNISIYNLIINVQNGSVLGNISGDGWLCKPFFSITSQNNYIINCSLIGESGLTGALIGTRAASSPGAELYVYCCSNELDIPSGSGGIFAYEAGVNGGRITCEQCWSTGTIGSSGGGIFGTNSGSSGFAIISAIKCYSTGTIGTGAGGIFGNNIANDGGTANANSCYSLGTIDTNAGGIFGSFAGPNGGNTFATNCYSAGTIGPGGGGIYGSNKQDGDEFNCYAAGGSWSTSAANLQLAGIPSGGIVGTTWVETVTGKPYELNNMGYTPYTVDIITETPSLNQTYSQTVTAGQTTVSALNPDASGNIFRLLKTSGGNSGTYGTIGISQQTGAITTTPNTESGTYTLVIRSIGSYNITTFILTVTGGSSPSNTQLSQVSCCAIPLYLTGDDYDVQADAVAGNAIIANFTERRGPISYSALIQRKIANASKRR